MADVTQQKYSSYLLLLILIVFLVATLTAVTVFLKKNEIEIDLMQRANRLLAVSGLLKGKVKLDGRDAYIEGSVSSEKNKEKVINIVNDVEGVRTVSENIIISPIEENKQVSEKPLKKIEKPAELKGRFTLRYDAGEWVLVGKVDSELTKQNLIESTQEVIGENIHSLLTIDPSRERPRWINKYLHVLEAFSYVYGGAAELTLNKGILTIGGNVDSEAAMRLTLQPIRKTFGEVVSIRNTLRILKFEDGLYQPEKSHEIEKIDLSDIQFNTENTEIQSAASLNELVSILNANQSLYLEISGHTDFSSDEDKNIQVSLARALLVRDYLVKQGVKKSHLRASGYGSSRPINKERGSQQNQRIEVTVIREG